MPYTNKILKNEFKLPTDIIAFKFFEVMRNIIIILILFQISCTKLSSEEKIIKKTLGKTIDIGMFPTVQQGNKVITFNEFREKYQYISLVYLEDGCNPCYPRYIEWQKRMNNLLLNDKFTVLFIIKGYSSKIFFDKILEIDPEYCLVNDQFYIVMDEDYLFLTNNPDFERWIIDKTMLIDEKNKVKLIGPPFASPSMVELFYNICNK